MPDVIGYLLIYLVLTALALNNEYFGNWKNLAFAMIFISIPILMAQLGITIGEFVLIICGIAIARM